MDGGGCLQVRKDPRKPQLTHCVGRWNSLMTAPWLDAEGPVGPVAAMGTGLRTKPSRSREAPPGKKTSWPCCPAQGQAGSVGGVIFSSSGGWGWTCMALLSGCITHPLSCLTLDSCWEASLAAPCPPGMHLGHRESREGAGLEIQPPPIAPGYPRLGFDGGH